MTLTVGFRLGNDTTSRQVTVLVTEAGVLHRAHGLYGKPARLSTPEPSRTLTNRIPAFKGETPLARPLANLRAYHASYTKKGYARTLIPPTTVRLDVEELPHQDAEPHRELVQAFIGAAPNTPQPLDQAIKEFQITLGLPAKPASIPRAPRDRAIPPRVTAMLRTLASGSPITPAHRLPVGWTVTDQSVRLHVGTMGETLDRQAVVELQAALSAWLHFTKNPAEAVPLHGYEGSHGEDGRMGGRRS
ncbi:hypothetical protein ACIA78_35190 [Streptomyces xanthochromogenes]|uniref:hypothetical protein n=1 Tax=Streptomyces xanthochromogenes TaxID=67384 RepID=UPI0037B16044